MFLKLFSQKFIGIFFRRAGFLLVAAFLLNSCSDSGCIDADDFGEYESQTLEIPSNSSQESCSFDYAKELTDPEQGSGIKVCLISGNVAVTDEQGIEQQSASGCNGFADVKFRNICINNCVQLCSSNSSSSSASAEPNWTATDQKVSGKNIGVTIRPGSEVMVRAIGSVVLGDSVDYRNLYVQATESSPHSKSNVWADTFFDVRRNQALFVKFSGLWNDGADAPDAATVVGGGSTPLGGPNDNRVINGAKRLVAYIVPHPAGYEFDTSAATEKSGAKGVTLLPDPEAWQCTYTGGVKTESNCSTAAYSTIGYTNISDSLINTVFPITSDFRSTVLGRYGGMIRWNNDDLKPESEDPFTIASVICNGTTGNCNNISNVSATRGVIVGDLSGSQQEIVNSTDAPIAVSLRSLTGDANCNITSNISVENSASSIITTINAVTVTNNSWTTEIALESGHKLVIPQNNQSYPSGVNCGRVIGVKKTAYHSITIEQSGFVRFTMVRGAGTCSLKGRIINPEGSHFDIDSSYTADFYEYDSFSTTPSGDPLDNLTVTASPPIGSLVWTPKIFVRKGQVIRFSPQSWNGEWTTSAGSQRQCGIGMAMVIEPRPALLCRGKADDVVDNPNCIPDLSGASLIGCQARSVNCDDPNSISFCPAQCRKDITCTPGNSANNYQKTDCTAGSTPAGCTYVAPFSEVTCNSCANEMLVAATQPAKIGINLIDQCYDLESYKGKVANIPSSNALTKAQVDAFLGDNNKRKGLSKLGTFSSDYGNLDNFKASPDTDVANGNIIYQLKSPFIFTNSGRLRFFILDGKDFNGTSGFNTSYNNNSVPGGSYSGSNGFMINTSGTLEFSNGTWLQVRMCKESGAAGVDCKGSETNDPTPVAAQPLLVELSAPLPGSTPGADPVINSEYKFNDYGNLVRRTANPQPGDCTIAVTGIESYAGALFYCHTYQYFDKGQLKRKTAPEVAIINADIANLRLTFKILDPEIGNCTISLPNDGVIVDNPFYDSSTPGVCNVGGGEIPGDGSIVPTNNCRKQFYCANKYHNNHGKYYVNVKVKNPTNGSISNIIRAVINPIVEIMDGKKDDPNTPQNEATIGQAERVYKLLISDSRYQAILTIALVTMFTFYGFGYLIGVVEMSHGDIITRIIKIGLIYLFVSETGWDWFNQIVVKFFKEGTDYLAFMMASSFDNSPELLNAIKDGQFYDKSILFSSVDKVFSLFFSAAVRKKISALLFASIFGWAYLWIIYLSFLLYVFAVANAVLLYLTAQVFISILFVLGPIFFVFTLFSQTKEMFDNWLKQLIGFSLQQIFLLTTLAFFNMLMYEVLKMSLGYKICWDEVWTINIITRITLLSFWTIASLPPRTNAHSEVGNIGNPEGIPSLFTILFIWVIASLMNKFIGFMTDLAAGIAGGLKASALGKGVADAAAGLKKQAGAAIGKLAATVGFSPVRSLDKFLFDSGKLAEEARTKKRKQDAADLSNRNAMAKSGDDAVSKFKVENADKLSKMSQAEQRDALNKEREKAMHATGKKLGLDDKDIERLQNQTGLKYRGHNILAAGAQAIKQSAVKGQGTSTSLKNRDVKTTFSHKEGQEALSKMTADERKKFIDAAKTGKISVDEGMGKVRSRLAAGTLGGSELVYGAGAAIGKGGAAVGRGFRDAKRFFHHDKYDEARDQLVQEGIIAEHTKGFNWTRSGAEKKAISERMKENLAKQKPNKGNTDSAVAELERESDYLDRTQGIDESDDGIASKLAQKAGAKLKRAVRASDHYSKVKGTSAEDRRVGKLGESRDTSEDIDDLREERLEAESDLMSAEKEMQSMEGYSEMVDLQEKAVQGSATKGEQAKLARLQKAIMENSEAGIAARAAKRTMHQIDTDIKNMEIKQGKIGVTDDGESET